MALIQCPECKKDVSDKATSCPHCGHPIANQSISASISVPISEPAPQPTSTGPILIDKVWWYCRNCNTSVHKDNPICPKCKMDREKVALRTDDPEPIKRTAMRNKTTLILLIIISLVTLLIVIIVKSCSGSSDTSPSYTVPQYSARTDLSVKMSSWYSGGFGTVGIFNLTIKNNSPRKYKDVRLKFFYFAPSGTSLGSHESIIYEVFPPKQSKTIYEHNAGLLPPGSESMKCGIEVVDAVEMP